MSRERLYFIQLSYRLIPQVTLHVLDFTVLVTAGFQMTGMMLRKLTKKWKEYINGVKCTKIGIMHQ